MKTSILRVTDDTPRAEIAEALINACAHAHRQPCVVGTADMPSKWDSAHALLDALLTDWEAAPA